MVYGGYGFFGRCIVDDLLEHTSARIVVAGRNPPKRNPWENRVTLARSDVTDLSSVEKTLSCADVVVHCAGPYQSLPLNPLRAAITCRVHYVDLAEDRLFARKVRELDDEARRARIAVMTGMSTVPGLSAQLTQAIRSHFDRLHSVRTFIAPGSKGGRGNATFVSLLSGVGRPVRPLCDGQELELCGWSQPEWVEFPPPIGRRLQYLAIDVADYDLFPDYFGVDGVEFKSGSEFAWLNRSLSLLARLRLRTGFPPLERLAHLFRTTIRFPGMFGSDSGGVLVEVMGRRAGELVRHEVCITSADGGERIPTVLATIAVLALLRGEVKELGLVPHHTWLRKDRFEEELIKRGLRIWWKSNQSSGWQDHFITA
ncbi:MAG: saccharopine dehydrogenase NADP-binding domain-containing protein [Armatimonadetes bacterium]|nr:saccharopine dehydrogenase NADP-binding domain-containing protein [Armatimonadota bacterium]